MGFDSFISSPSSYGWGCALVRVAVYARVSTEDQAKEGFSLEAQRERLRAYCTAKGWQVAKEYVDEGYSGRDVRRPAYQQMILERDYWDTLLVVKMDRIHRNARHFMQMMEDLNAWGKEFASMQESLDTSTAMGRFVVDIIQRIAQLESEVIGERVYMGMEQKAKTTGGILGFKVPYGYDHRDGRLFANLGEAPVVRRIFADYLAGLGTGRIARALNIEGVASKNGRSWSQPMVLYLLRNPLYCGYNHWEGHLKPGPHEALVSNGDFNRAQELIALRTKVPYRRKGVFLLPTPELSPT